MALAILLALVLGVLWLGLFGLGVVVTWRGLKGRVVDDHARCAQCRYVITSDGRRPSRCPECGSDLHGVGTVRLGLRRAHSPQIAAGALIMLLSMTPSGLFIDLSPPPVGAAAPAPMFTSRAAPVAPARSTSDEQLKRLRQSRKEAAGRAASRDHEREHERLRADDQRAIRRFLESEPPDAAVASESGDPLVRRPAAPEYPMTWMTRALGLPVEPGADPAAAVPAYGVPSPASPLLSDAGYGLDPDVSLFDYEYFDDDGSFPGSYNLARPGVPRSATGPLRLGRYGAPWESDMRGADALFDGRRGANRLPSTRIDTRVAPSYIGPRPAAGTLGRSPIGPTVITGPTVVTGPTGPTGPTPGAIAPSRIGSTPTGPRPSGPRPARIPGGR